MYEAIDRGTHVYMVIEYAAGGELWDYIENHGPIPQGRAKKLFHQVRPTPPIAQHLLVSHSPARRCCPPSTTATAKTSRIATSSPKT
jgi:hypothetical protein